MIIGEFPASQKGMWQLENKLETPERVELPGN